MAVNLGSAYGEIVIGTEKSESNVQSLASKLTGIGAKMSAAITAPLAGIAAAGVKATMQFSQSMNTLQTVSGATGAAMQQVQATALQLGKDTSFSANEAAAGMLELAKAGFNTQQTIAAIPGVLDLAAAGELEVAQAAEIAANAINAFNRPASDAGRVADILAAAANASSIEVTDLAQSFNQAGAVFATNKQSIEDLATAVGILGNNGIKGSDAGTSLKTAMMRLTAPTDQAAAVMKDLGIQVYNSDGSMRGFRDILASTEKATAGMTDAQRNQALTTLFGADAIRAMSILLKEGTAGWDEMKDAVTETGVAQDVADSKMRGLAGAIKYIKGTIESTLIAAFLPLEEAAANMVRSIADLIGKFAELPAPVRNAAMAFVAVMAAAGPLLLAIPAIGAVIGALLSPIGLVVAAVAGLAAAWVADWGGIREITANVVSQITAYIKRAASSFDDIRGAIQWIFEGKGDNIDWWYDIVAAFGATGAAGERLAAGLFHVGATLSNLLNTARALAPLIQDSLLNALTSMQSGLSSAAASISAIFGPAIQNLSASFRGMIAEFSKMGPEFQSLFAAAAPVFSGLMSLGQQLASFFASGVAVMMVTAINLIASAFQQLPAIVSGVVSALTALFTMLTSAWQAAAAMFTAIMAGDWSAAWAAAQAIVQAVATGIHGILQGMLSAAVAIITAIATAVTTTIEQMGGNVRGVMSALQGAWNSAWGAISGAATGAMGRISGAITTLIGYLGSLSSTMRTVANVVGSIHIPNPFKGLVSGAASAIGMINAVKNAAASLGSLRIPGFAVGTTFAPGGIALVGERGPELVTLPRGAKVETAPKTRSIMQDAQGATEMVVNQTLQFFGQADASAVRKAADNGLREAAWSLGVNLA